jgi:hypothetical protein
MLSRYSGIEKRGGLIINTVRSSATHSAGQIIDVTTACPRIRPCKPRR